MTKNSQNKAIKSAQKHNKTNKNQEGKKRTKLLRKIKFIIGFDEGLCRTRNQQ